MIFDNIRSIRQYEGLGSNFQKAVQFLEALDLSRISQGDFEIDGRKVYAFANWLTLKKPEEVFYEAHRKYADIQLVLQNSEVIYTAQTPDLTMTGEFDEQKDIGFYSDGKHSTRLTLFPGDFAVFFPEDAHKPCCLAEDPSSFKLVVKVRLE